MIKKTKSGDKEIDIAPMIKSIRCVFDPQKPGVIHISAMLSAGSAEHLNPEMLIKLARTHTGILDENDVSQTYSILRTKVYFSDGKTQFR